MRSSTLGPDVVGHAHSCPALLSDRGDVERGWARVKKPSNRARRQRDDRAFAEFDAMMRRLARTTQRETPDGRVDSGRYRAGEKEQTGSNASQD